ncbi:polysaccharide deacetylase [Halorarum halophilum]|uniref:Polysaccharide deacetylase n=1 Tax=Halorarum halophilum TaxID=2743090 RepID=A0A7D5GBB0_9EURY|nr:polysaccharide deacetylase [Halobaculum halophilum]QLG27225.1 polysaccharide deacetylase [Halobaculum halophilum]
MAGTLTLSIEIELGWGVHDLPTVTHLSDGGRREREYLDKLLDKADETGVPISFDIVGHLLLAECDGSHDGPYPAGWFDADPGTDVESDGLFYGPDLARRVLNADVDHELCTHTFSHLLCGQVSDDLLDAELRRVRELHEEFDAPVSSFVPPRHSRPNDEVLRRNGIRVARYAKSRRSPTHAHRFKQLTVGPAPHWAPRVEDGLLQTYCTSYPSLTALTLPSGQEDPYRGYQLFPLAARKRVHEYNLRRATRRAIESESPFHLWCHLYDLSNEDQWSVLERYLEHLGDIPDEELNVMTMKSLGDRYLER